MARMRIRSPAARQLPKGRMIGAVAAMRSLSACGERQRPIDAFAWFGRTRTARPARSSASSVSRPLEGRQRPKKPATSLLQVTFPAESEVRRFRLRLPIFPAVLRPLVRNSADRHATTGTCEIGRDAMYGFMPSHASGFCENYRIRPKYPRAQRRGGIQGLGKGFGRSRFSPSSSRTAKGRSGIVPRMESDPGSPLRFGRDDDRGNDSTEAKRRSSHPSTKGSTDFAFITKR